MNDLQERLPELYAALHPEGRFQEYFAQMAELRAAAAQMDSKERWEKLNAITESKEAKEYVAFRSKVLQQWLLRPGGLAQLTEYLQLHQKESQELSALFDPQDAPPVSYPKEIAGYVLQTIGLYCDALKKTPEAIALRFDTAAAADEDGYYRAELQPTIGLTFDGKTRRINVGELWNETVGLERDGRKNAQIWAESVWPEYRKETVPRQITRDAEEVRQLVSEEYAGADVKIIVL